MVGRDVHARYAGNGKWYEATVAEVLPDGAVVVDWDDEDSRHRRVPEQECSTRSAGELTAEEWAALFRCFSLLRLWSDERAGAVREWAASSPPERDLQGERLYESLAADDDGAVGGAEFCEWCEQNVAAPVGFVHWPEY